MNPGAGLHVYPQGRDRIVLFDGLCPLCCGMARFLAGSDRKKRLSFAAFRSPEGREILQQHGYPGGDPSSVLYLKNGILYENSGAVLEIVREMGFPWNVLYLLILIPRGIRDSLYRFIAKHRRRIAGRQETCRVS